MAWVQIQESPSNSDTLIWKVYHSGGFTTYLKYGRSNYFTICVSPSSSENVCQHVWPSGSAPNLWVHASIRIQSDTKQGHLCIIEWNGTSNCATASFSGAITPFDNNSYIVYGSHYYFNSHLVSPKMQIVDYRYYVGTCLSYSEISTIRSNTGCHSSCTNGCAGPGNYACGEFIQLIDPYDGWTGDGSHNVENSAYVRWHGTDSFMMGKTFSGRSSAFTGWINFNYIHSNWVNLFRAQQTESDLCGNYERIPAIFHIPQHGYHQCHCRGGDQNVINTGAGTGYIQNNWHFVAFSTCVSSPKMESCYTDGNDNIQCATDSGSLSYGTMTYNSSQAYLYVGDKWYQGPSATFKDVRYYHTDCLSQS